jgi:integrase
LARHLIEVLGNRSTTVEKKVGWLRAAVNVAVEDQKLSFNPFQKVVPRLDDGLQKLPLSAEDMESARSNLDHLSASDQLLWKLLATTGMRLSEAFQSPRNSPRSMALRRSGT